MNKKKNPDERDTAALVGIKNLLLGKKVSSLGLFAEPPKNEEKFPSPKK